MSSRDSYYFNFNDKAPDSNELSNYYGSIDFPLGYSDQSHHSAGLNIVECCEATVNPLILLAVLAGVAALTILLRQLGKNNHIH